MSKTANDTLMSIASLCRHAAFAHRGRVAFIDADDSTTTFNEFHRRTNRLAHAVRKRGVAPGDRVACLLLSGPAHMELAFALAKLGAILVPLNWRLAAAELAYILDNSQPSLWLVSSGLATLAADTGSVLPMVFVDDDAPAQRGDYAALVDGGNADDIEPMPASNAVWIIKYTSGTTGRPKGCMLTQRGWYVAALSSAMHRCIAPDDCFLNLNPLFHVGGFGSVLAYYAVGASSVLLPRPPEPAVIHRYYAQRCTAGTLPRPYFQGVIDAQKAHGKPLKLRHLVIGGGMETPERLREIRALLSPQAFGTYGQTEQCGFDLISTLDELLDHPGAMGRPMAHIEVRIVADDGNDAAPGTPGEFLVRGPSVMVGYWNDPQASAETLKDGWLRAGDIVRADENGLLYFVDRSKDMIKSGGENVYPREVELALLDHPAIADCCVVGVPDQQWGEAVKAFLVLKPGETINRADVKVWCKDRIAGYKRPRYVEFLEAIPGRDAQKPLKRALRERPINDTQRIV